MQAFYQNEDKYNNKSNLKHLPYGIKQLNEKGKDGIHFSNYKIIH